MGKFGQRRDEDYKKVGNYQKDNIKLTLRVSKLQAAVKDEHDRWLTSTGQPVDETFQWWTSARTRLQDELFQAEHELHAFQGAREEALQVAEKYFKKRTEMKAVEDKRRLELQVALEEEHLEQLRI